MAEVSSTTPVDSPRDEDVRAIVGERLSLAAFSQLSGTLGGYPFVKFVIDRTAARIHYLNHRIYPFHADYIAENLLGIPIKEMDADIDHYNQTFYRDPNRRFLLGILSLHHRDEKGFYSIETVEVDTMELPLLEEIYTTVRQFTEPSIPIFLKPANHLQEAQLARPECKIPKILAHELFATSKFIPLNPGKTTGRLRVFVTHEDYAREKDSLEWFDIIVMPKVPDDIPRLAGIINAEHTTPLSHTNVLASGWQIPNAIQIGILERIRSEGLAGNWVEYSVEQNGEEIGLGRINAPDISKAAPAWRMTKIHLEQPEITNVPLVGLEELRTADRLKYGTKAANLGEIHFVLQKFSSRLLGYYQMPRPPRKNLLPYLAELLGVPESASLPDQAWSFLKEQVHLPRGIAIPFAVQQRFFESSPKIQQAVGKLKMALELGAPQVDALCVSLQKMIVATRFTPEFRDEIDSKIATTLSGVSSFVVRSSSNAEDLEHFSAAGIYESINHVTSADKIFDSIKQVWASVLSPRSVRLRQQVGIPLDDVYMGVIVQEEIRSRMGGVMVTSNPANRGDFRNVYLNISPKSVVQVVQGTDLPYQCLFNTVEGGGRTLSLGSAKDELTTEQNASLQRLAVIGRLLQSHFSPDYTFAAPVDIEWLANEEGIHILQLRPYAG
jgi:hypothetical protein